MTPLLILTHLLAAVVGVVLAVAYTRRKVAEAEAVAAWRLTLLRRKDEAHARFVKTFLGEGAR